MSLFTKILIGFVALQHFGFMILETFFWNHPIGQKIFKTTPAFTAQSATLAANQGLYNGFLACGLLWSLFITEPQPASLQYFFLGCVVVAGLYGAYSVSHSILWVQAAPAALALISLFIYRGH